MTTDPEDQRSDEALLADLASGDRDCAEILSRRYWDAIKRFCSSYLSDPAMAEDVTQETFAKITSGDATPSGALRPWLYKIARNRCLDILRRHQRSPTHHNRINTGFDAARDTAGPRTRVAREERRELIRQIIESMPEEYRSVLTLKHFEDCSRAEMAEILDISEAAVKGRLVRASEHLRAELLKITRLNP